MKPSTLVLTALLLAPAAALAADSQPAVRTDPVLEQVGKATASQDWPTAQALLKDAIARNPGNADYHNLYAYSIRKGANPDMSVVFKHYNEALRLDPRHRGAHEYIGEAYLMTGNVAKAKEHLTQLERLCAAGCAEQTALAREISLFERQHAAK